MQARAATFAVVLRTYEWDDFVARQVERYRLIAAKGDLFISVDETRGVVGPADRSCVVSTTDAGLQAIGLANRFEKGSLVWWNNDYPWYAFHREHPSYDFYVFVEYDSAILGDLAPIISRVADLNLDFVAAPITGKLRDWFWWRYARQSYDEADIRASLTCVSILSNRALSMLFERRLAMASDPSVRQWPLGEAFVATEIARAGFAFAPLADFGDDGDYRWFPPLLEDDLGKLGGSVFVHPVLDAERYVSSILRSGRRWRDYFDRSSPLRQRLRRLPRDTYASRLLGASLRQFSRLKQEQLECLVLRARMALGR